MTKSNLHLLGCNTNLAMSSSENKLQKQTYWFYKWPLWLRILLLITLPGIFIPVAVWPKIKIPNWVKGVLLIPWSFVVLIAYIIMLAIIVSPFSSTSTKGPTFNVSGISEGEIKKDDKVSFKIKTEPLTVDEVTINGESATKKGWDSEYSLDKTFPEGDNLVKIVVKKDEKITEKEFNFKVDLSERKAGQTKKDLENKEKEDLRKKEEDIYNAERIKERDLRATFDSKLGNIYMAANQAQIIKSASQKSDWEFYVNVMAEDDQIARYNDGHPESQLLEKIQGVRLVVNLNSTEWNLSSESTKKDFVTVMYNAIKSFYPDVSSVRVIITNGIRQVAEGSADVWNGGVEVDIK